MTLSSADELVVAGLDCYYGPTAAGTGYVTPGDAQGIVEYQIGFPSPSGITATVTDSSTSNDPYGMIMVAFKPGGTFQ
jgi:hypothetical protein